MNDDEKWIPGRSILSPRLQRFRVPYDEMSLDCKTAELYHNADNLFIGKPSVAAKPENREKMDFLYDLEREGRIIYSNLLIDLRKPIKFEQGVRCGSDSQVGNKLEGFCKAISWEWGLDLPIGTQINRYCKEGGVLRYMGNRRDVEGFAHLSPMISPRVILTLFPLEGDRTVAAYQKFKMSDREIIEVGYIFRNDQGMRTYQIKM